MGKFVILREDFFRSSDGTLGTVFTDEDGFPESRLRDDFDLFPWQADSATTGTELYVVTLGTGLIADTIAVLGHNLGSEGVTIKVQWGGAWTDALVRSPSVDDDLFLDLDGTLPGSVQTAWRIRLENVTADTQISELLLGRRIIFPDPPEPVFDPNQERRAVPGRGQIAGTAIPLQTLYRSRVNDFSFSALPETFLEADTNLSEYKFWQRTSALLGEPCVVHWQLGESLLENDFYWAVMRGVPSTTRVVPVRSDGVGGELGGYRTLRISFQGLVQ